MITNKKQENFTNPLNFLTKYLKSAANYQLCPTANNYGQNQIDIFFKIADEMTAVAPTNRAMNKTSKHNAYQMMTSNFQMDLQNAAGQKDSFTQQQKEIYFMLGTRIIHRYNDHWHSHRS